jgi:hypothetical protein
VLRRYTPAKMDPSFKQFVEMLHPSFERLMQMVPLKMSTLPSRLPEKCIYLLSEGQNHLYVGRTRKLRKRLRQHSIASAQNREVAKLACLAIASVLRGRTEGGIKNQDRECQ